MAWGMMVTPGAALSAAGAAATKAKKKSTVRGKLGEAYRKYQETEKSWRESGAGQSMEEGNRRVRDARQRAIETMRGNIRSRY